MRKIHAQRVAHGRDEEGRVDYVRGAHLAGFVNIADAMLAYGAI